MLHLRDRGNPGAVTTGMVHETLWGCLYQALLGQGLPAWWALLLHVTGSLSRTSAL